MSDPLAFMRSGNTDSAGKCSRRIDIPVTEELEEQLIALAVFAGRPKAEFARMLLVKAVAGELAYMRTLNAPGPNGDTRKEG